MKAELLPNLKDISTYKHRVSMLFWISVLITYLS